MIVKRRDRPNYRDACKQTVTLYHAHKSGGKTTYHRWVFERSAFLGSKRIWREGQTGISAANTALLVIPQGAEGKRYVDPSEFINLPSTFTLRVGDKAMPGVGKSVRTATDWAELTPANVAGLIVLSSVDVQRTLAGEIAHVEGG